MKIIFNNQYHQLQIEYTKLSHSIDSKLTNDLDNAILNLSRTLLRSTMQYLKHYYF